MTAARASRWVTACGAALLCGAVGSCAPAPDGLHLPVPDAGAAGVAQRGTRPGEAWSFGTLIVCAEPGQPAVVTGVRFVQPDGDLHLDGFAVRPNPMATGALAAGTVHGDLTSAAPRVRPGPGRADLPCPPPDAPADDPGPEGDEVVVQLHREGSRSAGTKALDIDYTVDGRPGTLRIPFTIRLCAPGDTSGHCGP